MSAPQLNTLSEPAFTDLVTRTFEEGLQEIKATVRASGLVVVEAIPEATGKYKRFSEMPDRSLYAKDKAEGAPGAQAKVQMGYDKEMAISRVALDIAITVEERLENKYPQVKQKLVDISTVCPNRMDLDLSHRFTFAFATSYTNISGNSVDVTVGDGFQAAYALHTLTGSATTYNNIVPGNPQFSKGSLAAAKRLTVEETYNNLGDKMTMDFDVIWCTDDEDTNNQIDELLHARADVNSSNAATFNVYENAMRKIRLPRLATTATGGVDTTKAKYWGIASTANSQLHLGVLQEPILKTPRDGNNGEDFSTENWNYAARSSYGIAMVGARWIKFSTWLWI